MEDACEEWKPIPSFSGYEASNLGRVRSLDRHIVTVRRGREWHLRTRGQLLTSRLMHDGYLTVELGAKARKVHRLVLEAFVGPAPEGCVGAHNDGCRLNNRLENLRWATRAENEADKIRHGTHLTGARKPTAKLTSDIVAELRRNRPAESQERLAARYGVCQATISKVLRGESWAFVPRD